MSVVYYNVGEGQSIFKAICRNPKNFDRYFILADFCEENKDLVAAECWRVLGEFKKYPVFDKESTPNSRAGFHYFWDFPHATLRSSSLPPLWLLKMDGIRNMGGTQSYLTRSDAYNNAIVGWRRMGTRQRKQCKKWLRVKEF